MPYNVRYDWQAEAAMNSLGSGEREQVRAALQRLRLRGGEFRTLPEVHRVADKLYVLRAGAYHVVFSMEPNNTISVQDIINHQFVQRYA